MQSSPRPRWLYCLFLASLTFSPQLKAQESCESIAEIISAQGEIALNGVLIDNASASSERLAVCIGDVISAGNLSRAAIGILDTETVIRIDQNTELRLTAPPAEKPSFLELIKGGINILSPAPQSLVVDAGLVNAAVEGTEFSVRVEDGRATVTVLEGSVLASNEAGEPVRLTSGESAIAMMGQAPRRDPTINAKETIQWALYYPQVIDYQRTQAGLTEADAGHHTRNAARYLSVGELDLASRALGRARQLDSANEEIWALETVTALTQNRAGEVEQLLAGVAAAGFESTAALIALSYAQQKQLQLQQALNTADRAVESDGQSWLALARRSELWLSLGERDRALQDAMAANAIAVNARSQTVLGFARLAATDVDAAADAFRQAIALGSEDPLPHLGLGLAKIRRGELAAGRRHIEEALGIDPENALVRSYLGKAFYEEKRGPLDERKFAQAKEQDPKDPTAWFYDAIRKQSVNDPIGALADLQKSIELNDNRAVYRSQLKLDEDLAARNAALGRIFGNLGLEQRALVEGWNSVNADPGDFSGHRFLADSYSAMPRHEIARVSELLRSQLLQPINLNPIQPQQAETDLFILRGAGPSEPGFNEFNPLFTSDGLRWQINGAGGTNSTAGTDVVVSGLAGRLSFSAGYFHYESDGFRANNDQDRDVYNLFLQGRVVDSTTLSLELRSSDAETGDLGLLFDPGNFTPGLRTTEDSDLARIGIHHSFTPGSELIATVSRSDADSGILDPFELPEFGISGTGKIDTSADGWNAEIQHLYRTERAWIISGIGALDGDRTQRIQEETQLPFPPFLVEMDSTFDASVAHENAYVYAHVEQSEKITWTFGLSADFYEETSFDRDQVNPKVGLSWAASPATTFRFAAFRTLKRPLIANQTIEPTQVAGFNQFFDGVEGEEAWRYGAAVDHRISSRFYGGLELSGRDLSVPIEFVIPGPVPTIESQRVDWDEKVARAYLHWVLSPELMLGIDYLYEEFEREGSVGPEQFSELQTHRVPVSVRYFHSCGFTGRLKLTFVDQAGIFGGFMPVAGSDRFAVVDAGISYRLPRRLGLLSLEALNLLDETFMFQDTDPANPRIHPGRIVLFKFNLSF